MDPFLKFSAVYSTNQETLIAQEFGRLKGTYYLDHAGATLYSEQQLQNILQDLSKNVYSNPHANNVTSKFTEDAIDIVRYRILEHFNTSNEEYTVIFVSSTTAALKTIAEYFDYGKKAGTLVHLENNHTSVLGMRNYATNSSEIKTEQAMYTLSCYDNGSTHSNSANTDSNSLFVFPAQCNFSGSKYPLSWIDKVKNGALNSFIKQKVRIGMWFLMPQVTYRQIT
uniref:Molybdenum cofactor sulfurase n=1 Tax=Anoplophora glabripennis TaxID=217634 RepID=V5I8X3_ANOGL